MSNSVSRRSPRVGAVVLLAAFLLAAGGRPAWGLKPTVVDGGDLFKAETVEKAAAVVRQIKQKYGKDVMIESYPAVPAGMQADLQKKGRDKFFADWMADRARALRVDGIFILVNKDPGRIQIGLGSGVAGKLFSQQDRQELQQVMTNSFRQGQFDDGLLKGVEFVQARLARNAGGAAAVPPPLPAPAPIPPANVERPQVPPPPVEPPPAAHPASAPTTQPSPAPAQSDSDF